MNLIRALWVAHVQVTMMPGICLDLDRAEWFEKHPTSSTLFAPKRPSRLKQALRNLEKSA